MDLSAIQQALRERNIDAWLFYDHHHRDPIAYRVLGLPDGLMVTRRWYYLIPAKGEPVKLVHKIESGHLDTLPGSKKQYAGWQELFDGLKQMLAAHRDVAMQYSPNNFVFTISMVDAGTADMIRGLGKNIVSAADLIAQFEATLTDEQIKSHFAARDVIDAVTAEAFKEIGRRVRNGGTHEHEIQQFFMEAFARENMVTDDPPIVAVNANSGNPHYEPSAKPSGADSRRRLGSAGCVGEEKYAGCGLLRHHLDGICGQGSVGPAARDFQDCERGARYRGEDGAGCGLRPAADRGMGSGSRGARPHHSRRNTESTSSTAPATRLRTEVHANGANMDDLEIHDERRILPNSCSRSSPESTCPSSACAGSGCAGAAGKRRGHW